MNKVRVRKGIYCRIIETRKGKKAVFRKKIYELSGDRRDYRVLGEAKSATFRGCLLVAANNVENFFHRVVAYRFGQTAGKFKISVYFYEKGKH